MVVNTSNYGALFAQYPPQNGLIQFHNEVVDEAMKNNWAFYHADAEIRDAVDLYFSKYGEFIEKQAKSATTTAPKAEAKPKPAPKPRAKKPRMGKNIPGAPTEPEPAPTPKAKSEPKPKSAPKPTPEPKAQPDKVGHIPHDTRFIQRFVGLHDKAVKVDRVKTLLRSMQKAIVEKRLRKSDRFAKELMTIQEKLVKVCNAATTKLYLGL